MNKLPKIKYHYLRNYNQEPIACVAVKIDREAGTIKYAFAKRHMSHGLTWLRERMRLIKELGGIVSGDMQKAFHNYDRDFSKKKVRFIANSKLEHSPSLIENVNLVGMDCHQITAIVMEVIANRFQAETLEGGNKSSFNLDLSLVEGNDYSSIALRAVLEKVFSNISNELLNAVKNSNVNTMQIRQHRTG